MIRKITILGMSLFFGVVAKAQCDQVFISEYVEGSRNNKAIELYNPTDKAIDLKDYRFTRWQNGSAVWSPQYSDKLSGTIQAYSTFLLVIDRTDSTAVGNDTAASKILLDKANLLLSKDYNTSYSMSFNGDDALSLDILDPNPSDPSNPYLPVDIFGKIGERPRLGGSSRTIGWSDSMPYNNGLGLWYTIDKTLIRKASVKSGITTNPITFNPASQWVPYPEDMFDSLGKHKCDCAVAGLNKNQTRTVSIFPNPAKDAVFIPMSTKATSIQIVSLDGKITMIGINETSFARMHGYSLDLSHVAVGQYLVYILDNQGVTYSARLIKE